MDRAVQYILACPLSFVGYLLLIVGQAWLGDHMDAVILAFIPVIGLYAGMVGTLWVGWLLYCDYSPRKRLEALHDDILHVLDNIHKLQHDPEIKAEGKALFFKLNRIGVIMPPPSNDSEWYALLPDLLAYSKDGRIDAARRLNDS